MKDINEIFSSSKSSKELFTSLVSRLAECIEDSDRNNAIREEVIFKTVLSQFLTDDERAKFYGLPNGCRIRENAKIIKPENFKCGEYVWIGEGAVLDASGGLEIGDHTSVGLYVLIWSHTSYLTNLSMSNTQNSPLIRRNKTTIGKGVFIAGPSVIYPGVTIGDKTAILPLTTITKSFKGNVILGGSPARIIKEISDEEIERLVRDAKERK